MQSLIPWILLAGFPFAPQLPTERLENSPRHHEWIDVSQGERKVRCFVAYPEVESKAPAVLVIHENRGLNDWARSVADQLAEAGYLAIAPDLLSGAGPEGGGTDSFESTDAARAAIYELDNDQVRADLDAVVDHVRALDACNGTLAVAGFCWGGSLSFLYATQRADLAAAFVFYGSPPEGEEAVAAIHCPVYGFYGEKDARITAGVPAAAEAMQHAGKPYHPVVYPGAGHGFMRSGEEPDASPENREAREMAWVRWKELLAELAD
jgi:carboxymethylenebutenolidase